MENEKYQDEFEQFLQDEVKQHRIFPSDHIWNNIRTELHGYRAWPALTFISLFIITALTVSTLVSKHPHEQPVLKMTVPQIEAAIQPSSVIAAASHKHNRNYFEQNTDGQITEETFATAADNAPVVEEVFAVNKLRDITLQTIPARNNKIPAAQTKTGQIAVSGLAENIFRSAVLPSVETKEEPPAEDQPASINNTITVSNEYPSQEVKLFDGYKKSDAYSIDEPLKTYTTASLSNKGRSSRFGFQFYITPSTSYRKLSDKKVKEVIQPAVNAITPLANIPPNTVITDVNTVVRHRPSIGMEMGFALLYNITPRLKFKTGIQLNVRQYHIETFQSLTNERASLSLINHRGVETISFYSPYNNNTGYKETKLDNWMYQVSVPLGIQWDIIQGSGIGFNAEASVQPTMTLNNNTYLLSTDYKHYADGNQFMRKWNINTSVGFNLSYKIGSASWQIGPQIRYQHLPTYSNAYPIRENLMDYGVRLGFTKQLTK